MGNDTASALTLLQLAAAHNQGYPPLPPKRPNTGIPPDAMHWLLEQNDMLPGFEEWQKQGAPPGVELFREGEPNPPSPPPGVNTTPGPTVAPPRGPGDNPAQDDAWFRLQLMHELAKRGWNV